MRVSDGTIRKMNDASTSAVCLGSSSSESSDSEGDATTAKSSVVSLLDEVPKLSELNRKRKSNSGGKRRKTSSSTSSEPKGVTPQQRVREFSGEHLTVFRGKLFCNACREEVSLKSSSVISLHTMCLLIVETAADYYTKHMFCMQNSRKNESNR